MVPASRSQPAEVRAQHLRSRRDRLYEGHASRAPLRRFSNPPAHRRAAAVVLLPVAYRLSHMIVRSALQSSEHPRNTQEQTMSAASSGAAAAAAAAAIARRHREEEESMTGYTHTDLAQDWEFKILRSSTS